MNYTFRMHDPRVGRFFAVDPLAKQYPHNSPYAFSENSVIAFIELEGLEKAGPKYTLKNVNFITLFNPWVSPVLRKDGSTFTETALGGNNANNIDYTINAQQYERTSAFSNFLTPSARADWKSQGQTIQKAKVITGRSSVGTFYIANDGKTWSFGAGDPPSDSRLAIGGGIPVIINGLPYGPVNKYSEEAPNNLPKYGDPGKGNDEYLAQRSNAGFARQDSKEIGKTILAYNSKDNSFLLVVQQDGTSGMSLQEIRDHLISKGYDNAISFDGSNSSTLVKDNSVIVEPGTIKNNTIPSGVKFSVEGSKKSK